jgi:hypothetical protein
MNRNPMKPFTQPASSLMTMPTVRKNVTTETIWYNHERGKRVYPSTRLLRSVAK